MGKPRKVKTIYIGTQDVQDWTQSIGKMTLMPLMFSGIKEIIENKKKKYHFARVECLIRDKKTAFDFWVKKDGIDESLEKCLEWALEEEEYEMCSEIKRLEKLLEKETEF